MTRADGEPTGIYDHYGSFKRCVGFQLTLRCPLSCAHCCVESGPHRSEEMDPALAAKWLEEIGRSGEVKVVSFTGGEPFLQRDRLRTLLTIARQYGLQTDIVTSSSWATSYERAVHVLQDLPPITSLTLSADKYHLEFLPLTRVKHAAQAALAVGITVIAFICLENDEDDFLTRFQEVMGEELWGKIRVMTNYVTLTGRAARSCEISSKVRRVPWQELPELGCPGASAPAILPDGRVMACCGSTMSDPDNWEALTIGDLQRESIREVFKRAEHNCLIHALRLLGPGVLAKLASDEMEETLSSRLYQRDSICDICREVCTNREVVASVVRRLEQPEVAAGLVWSRLLGLVGL